MKVLSKTRTELQKAARWDIDFHLPAEGIKRFPKNLLMRVDQVATIAKDKRDPGKKPEESFQYIDISAVDVQIGAIVNQQDVESVDAPLRARKVVRAYDLLVSTCRPTRGAVAVVPRELHNQIASTGFSVVRPKKGVNPYYLQFALRLPSTMEQFRKWSTGSSYPAILDEDVAKTLIPVPKPDEQDRIAALLVKAFAARDSEIRKANAAWTNILEEITGTLSITQTSDSATIQVNSNNKAAATVPNSYSIAEIESIIDSLPPIDTDSA
ncbi:restriction endonuclease subunit S [Neisseria sp. oral taxon 014]|uniref:restriction endonuclease subunit S n=1 Tax=Neisseria sp. oral taxon 014 TaxID=641148 RepID=UPI0025CD7AED|nr:restriction endonuclease subunit S [Neisseria sp. oral taxon 014]